MAQTTTDITACDASIWLDNATGTLEDISGSTNSVDLSFTKVIGELRTFQTRWPRRQECGKDCVWTLTIVYSTATDEALDIIKTWYFQSAPNLRTCTVYLPDKNIGSDMYSGEFRLQDLKIPASSGNADPVTVTATLVPSGEVILSTAAT
ncbi:MAG: hypothetical protein PHV98_00740 [Candidatus Omnitrophica bacterium]|nr:hypothetical protein [Candidatus Omnitrophota bacterium]